MTITIAPVKKFGETFGAELRAAGLGGLPFSWDDVAGVLSGLDKLTPEQQAAVSQVVAAHNSSAKRPGLPPKEKLLARTGLTEAELVSVLRALLPT